MEGGGGRRKEREVKEYNANIRTKGGTELGSFLLS